MKIDCPICGGYGRVDVSPDEDHVEWEICDFCQGECQVLKCDSCVNGEVWDYPGDVFICHKCKGYGGIRNEIHR